MRRRRPSLPGADTQVIGPYRLAHRIAIGGMAEVLRALWPQQAGGDRAVVIKRLLPSLAEDEEQLAMFDLEAQLGARIDHPNVVRLLDRGVHDGAPYIVLEYVFGVDLHRLMRWLRQRGESLPLEVAVWAACEVLRGLEAVHSASEEDGTPLTVVHRDVSPANVFLSVHGDVKLGDLGIARAALGREGAASVRAKGKLGYLPPEQVLGKEVDQRGDVYSAAVVISELLTGQPLFRGATEIAILLAIRDGDLAALDAVANEVPRPIIAALRAALERRPAERLGSARALREAIASAFPVDPEAKQRLASLVIEAHDDAVPDRDATSLAQTVEGESLWTEDVTPGRQKSNVEPESLKPSYAVDRDGEALGVFSLATLVRALTSGVVRATDGVQIDGGPRVPIARVGALAPHLPASTRTPSVRRRTEIAETSERYDLSRRSILSILVETLVNRERGLLLCDAGQRRKEIYLEAGVPCFVTSNEPSDLLGERLVRAKIIERSELDMALAIMPRFEGRLGETLVALGLVDPITLFRQIAKQVRERVLAIFSWSAGHAALYRTVPPPERAFPLNLDPWELLVEGARLRIVEGLERSHPLLQPGSVVGPDSSSPTDWSFSEPLSSVAQSCLGPRSLVEIEGIAPDPITGQAACLVLSELGLLRRLT